MKIVAPMENYHHSMRPPFDSVDILTEENTLRREWMLEQNRLWELDMEEEKRQEDKKGYGY